MRGHRVVGGGIDVGLADRLDLRRTGLVGLSGVVVDGGLTGDGFGGGPSGGRFGCAATLRVIEQGAHSDGARRLRAGTLGGGGGALGALRHHSELVSEPLHLRLELQDLGVVRAAQRLNEFADLLHLQPQVRAQHDEVVQSVAEHPAIGGEHGVAVGLVELGEDPRQIARGIVDLHILPIGDGGDGGTGEEDVAVVEPTVHGACGERPESFGLQHLRPAGGDLGGDVPGLTQPLDPGGQLGADLPGGERRIAVVGQERPMQAMDGADGRADGRAVVDGKHVQWPGVPDDMGTYHNRGAAGRSVGVIAGFERRHPIHGEPQARGHVRLTQRVGGAHAVPEPLPSGFGIGDEHVVQFA